MIQLRRLASIQILIESVVNTVTYSLLTKKYNGPLFHIKRYMIVPYLPPAIWGYLTAGLEAEP